MGYIERIQSDLTAAMKEKDELRLSVLRMVKSALKYKEIEKIHPLTDLESLQVLQTLVKQRRESVDQFRKGGQTDLARRKQKRSRSSSSTCLLVLRTKRCIARSTKLSRKKARAR